MKGSGTSESKHRVILLQHGRARTDTNQSTGDKERAAIIFDGAPNLRNERSIPPPEEGASPQDVLIEVHTQVVAQMKRQLSDDGPLDRNQRTAGTDDKIHLVFDGCVEADGQLSRV
jgi:hypothetical protein